MSKEQEALDAANAALAELAEHITVRQTAIKAAERDEAAIIAERDAAEADENATPAKIAILRNKARDAKAEVERQKLLLAKVQAERGPLVKAQQVAARAERAIRLASVIKRRDKWLAEGVPINDEIIAIDNEERSTRSNALPWLAPDSVAAVIDYDETLIAPPKKLAPPKDWVPMQCGERGWRGSDVTSVFGVTCAYAPDEIAWFSKPVAAQLERCGKWMYAPQAKAA